MAKYRRRFGPGKPFDAFKYAGGNINTDRVPGWAASLYKEGTLFHKEGELFLKLVTGPELVRIGDYVTLQGSILGVYPGKSFETFYEGVRE